MDNNNEYQSRQLGAAFLVVGWIAAIAIIAILINNTLFGTKKPSISDSEAGKQIVITRDYDSHFRITGSINGLPVTFLIDTGATSVAIPAVIAKKAKLVEKTKVQTETAAGDSVGYLTRIDVLNVGGVDVHNISAIIIPDFDSDQVLLGMNVLSKFSIEQSNNTLTLTVPNPTK